MKCVLLEIVAASAKEPDGLCEDLGKDTQEGEDDRDHEAGEEVAGTVSDQLMDEEVALGAMVKEDESLG